MLAEFSSADGFVFYSPASPNGGGSPGSNGESNFTFFLEHYRDFICQILF